jgi:hypothetical protein
MSYHSNGDRVMLEMSVEDYRTLTGLLSIAVVAGPRLSWAAVKFVNGLNEGNPDWIPYATPVICAHCGSHVTNGHACQTEKVS